MVESEEVLNWTDFIFLIIFIHITLMIRGIHGHEHDSDLINTVHFYIVKLKQNIKPQYTCVYVCIYSMIKTIP